MKLEYSTVKEKCFASAISLFTAKQKKKQQDEHF